MVVLHEFVRNSNFCEGLLVITFQKESAIIGKYLGLEHKSASERSF
jgi:hypothetical protein